MFKVDIEKNKEKVTYYVFDKEEVVQTAAYGPRSFFIIDSTIEKITEVIPQKEGVIYIIKNPTPAIIKEDDLETYINDFQEMLRPYGMHIDVGKIPLTPITERDYKRLKALSEYQNEEEKKEEIKDDVKLSWQLVRKLNPTYGYHTY